jgi:predicted GNAT superfamily acetyltransferase
MARAGTTIRRARDLEDYQACIDLQKVVWGFSEAADFAALPLLVVGNRLGGNVLVAQDNSGRCIGFSYALLAKKVDGQEIWWSHMTAVLPEVQNREVGLRLKLRQREEALNEGIEEIHWTFDPLQSVNGHFNVSKLGVVVHHYEENIYGLTSSVLHHGLPTDRFVAEWRLNSERVRERIDLASPAVVLRDLDRIPYVNPGGAEPRLDQEDQDLLVEIPTRVRNLPAAEILRWQGDLRSACRHYFKMGYAVTDFIRLQKGDGDGDHAYYLLSRTSAL